MVATVIDPREWEGRILTDARVSAILVPQTSGPRGALTPGDPANTRKEVLT